MTVVVECDLRHLFGPARDQGPRPTCMTFAASDTHAAVRPNWEPLSCEYAYYHALRYDPWFARAPERLKMFGTEVVYMVSDRAKALIKLAHTGLGCPSIPDLFPLGHDLVKGYSLCLCGRLRQATRALDQAEQSLEKLMKHDQAEPTHVAQAQAHVVACTASLHHWQEVGRAWRQHLSNGSCLLHPWRLLDSLRQTSQEVEEQWRAERKAIEALRETNGVPMKQDTLDKVHKQRAGISALVDFWWQTVSQDLTPLAMTPRGTQGAQDVLLPLQ